MFLQCTLTRCTWLDPTTTYICSRNVFCAPPIYVTPTLLEPPVAQPFCSLPLHPPHFRPLQSLWPRPLKDTSPSRSRSGRKRDVYSVSAAVHMVSKLQQFELEFGPIFYKNKSFAHKSSFHANAHLGLSYTCALRGFCATPLPPPPHTKSSSSPHSH